MWSTFPSVTWSFTITHERLTPEPGTHRGPRQGLLLSILNVPLAQRGRQTTEPSPTQADVRSGTEGEVAAVGRHSGWSWPSKGLERRKLFPSPGPTQVGIRLLWEPFATRGPGFKTKRAGDRSIEWFKQANE